MTDENKRYEIRQLLTTGWEIVDESMDTNLTREQCDGRIKYYSDDGIPPNRIQVKRIS